MPCTTTNESGFSLIEALLVLITITLITGIGYFIWHTQQSASPATLQSTASNKTTPTNQPEDSTALIKTAVKKYPDNVNNTDAVITITHSNDEFALGDIASPQGDGGAQWFAQRKNGVWTVVSQGADGHCEELAAHNLTSWDETCNI